MKNLIDKLTELRDAATQGEWENITAQVVAKGSPGGFKDANDNYLMALHQAFPLIKQHFDAMERLVEAVAKMGGRKTVEWNLQRDAALAEFREAIGG